MPRLETDLLVAFRALTPNELLVAPTRQRQLTERTSRRRRNVRAAGTAALAAVVGAGALAYAIGAPESRPTHVATAPPPTVAAAPAPTLVVDGITVTFTAVPAGYAEQAISGGSAVPPTLEFTPTDHGPAPFGVGASLVSEPVPVAVTAAAAAGDPARVASAVQSWLGLPSAVGGQVGTTIYVRWSPPPIPSPNPGQSARTSPSYVVILDTGHILSVSADQADLASVAEELLKGVRVNTGG